MPNFTKTVRCLVVRTAQQIDTKLMHPFEKFRQNLLVKFILWSILISDTQSETEKNFSLPFFAVQNIESLKPCHVLLKQPSEGVFVF